MLQNEKILLQGKLLKRELHNYIYHYPQQLDDSLKNFKRHELIAMFFTSIEKPAELCKILKKSFTKLENVMNDPHYKSFSIKKKRTGYREIFAPEKDLKRIQKQINFYLQAYYFCIKPKEVHGFVINPGKLKSNLNIVENALLHTNKKHVLNIDLRDFFPSISSRQVIDLFSSPYFNFDQQLSTALTLLTTYRGRLPIGAPTSPVLSNFICLQLDYDIIDFCTANNLTYSRYADDLTFSSNTVISSDNLLDIINIIKKNNFSVNDKKVRLKSSNRRQIVTGLTVNEKVNVDRTFLKKSRAMLHDLKTNGLDIAVKRHFQLESIDQSHKAKFIFRLEGYINFIGQVRGKTDELYIKQRSVFDSIFEPKRS